MWEISVEHRAERVGRSTAVRGEATLGRMKEPIAETQGGDRAALAQLLSEPALPDRWDGTHMSRNEASAHQVREDPLATNCLSLDDQRSATPDPAARVAADVTACRVVTRA